MSSRIPPGYAEIVMTWSTAGDPEPMLTALGVNLATGITPSVANANEMTDILADQLVNFSPSNYTLGPGWVTFGQDGPDDIKVVSSNATVVGTQPTTVLPNNCATLIHKLSQLAGRRGRGRMYVPPPPEGEVSSIGALSTQYLSDRNTNVNTLLTNIAASSLMDGAVIFHSSAPFDPTDVTDLQVDGRIATQRKRLR